MDLTLIYPPFAHPRSPHLAAPTLAAYLAEKGRSVSIWDANLDYFHWFLCEKQIEAGRRHAAERLRELNAQTTLGVEEKNEYLTLATLLQSTHQLALNYETVWGEAAADDPMEREFLFKVSAALAAGPYRPEGLTLLGNIPSVQYQTRRNNYASADVLGAPAEGGLLGDYFREALAGVFGDAPPRAAGLSVGVEDQIQPAVRLARIVRELYPDVALFLGGSFVTTAMEGVDHPGWLDVFDGLVVGDGERPLEILLDELDRPDPDWSRVPGLIYREGGRVRRNQPEAPLALESLPPPDFSLLDLTRYLLPAEAMTLPFRSSRGCYWRKCDFCRTDSHLVRHYRQAPADYLAAAMEAVQAQTGARSFAFTDEASSPVEMERLARIIAEEEKGWYWSTCFRFEPTLTAERCRTLARGGLANVNFGFESYSQRLLDHIHKGTRLETVFQVLAAVSAAGVFPFAYMMVGLPSETEHEAKIGHRGVRWLAEKGFLGDYSYSFFQLYPDSRFFREAETYGLTAIDIPAGQDLIGPIDRFEAPGMDRETAQRLSRRFNLGQPPALDNRVPLPGGELILSRDLNRLLVEDDAD